MRSAPLKSPGGQGSSPRSGARGAREGGAHLHLGDRKPEAPSPGPLFGTRAGRPALFIPLLQHFAQPEVFASVGGSVSTPPPPTSGVKDLLRPQLGEQRQ